MGELVSRRSLFSDVKDGKLGVLARILSCLNWIGLHILVRRLLERGINSIIGNRHHRENVPPIDDLICTIPCSSEALARSPVWVSAF